MLVLIQSRTQSLLAFWSAGWILLLRDWYSIRILKRTQIYKNTNSIIKTAEWMVHKVLSLCLLHLFPSLTGESLNLENSCFLAWLCCFVHLQNWKLVLFLPPSQGLHMLWDTWKVIEFKNFIFKSWKVMDCLKLSVLESHGKWKFSPLCGRLVTADDKARIT